MFAALKRFFKPQEASPCRPMTKKEADARLARAVQRINNSLDAHKQFLAERGKK